MLRKAGDQWTYRHLAWLGGGYDHSAYFRILGSRIMWWQSEEEVIKRIIDNKTSLANCISFALNTAFTHPEHPWANDILVSVNIPRTELGLNPEQKPGDIDLLIIPFNDFRYFFDRSIAIEVKVLRPTIAKPSRNVNSMGLRQTLGLLRDGFPFVGLIHIAIPESTPSELVWDVPVISDTLGPNGELIETGRSIAIDPFPVVTAERQEGRINTMGLPIEIGFSSTGLALSADGDRISGGTVGLSRTGLPNPNFSQSLLGDIEKYFINNRESFSEIRWLSESRKH